MSLLRCLRCVLLLVVAGGASAADIVVVTPGSAGAYVFKPQRGTLPGLCAVDASRAAVGTCCQSTNTEHVTRSRAALVTGTYRAVGSNDSLGAVGTTVTYLKKSGSASWGAQASCP